jgi:hypothetical protein
VELEVLEEEPVVEMEQVTGVVLEAVAPGAGGGRWLWRNN